MDLWNNKVVHHVLAIFMMKDSDIFLSDVNNVHIYNCWQIPDHFIPTFFNAKKSYIAFSPVHFMEMKDILDL